MPIFMLGRMLEATLDLNKNYIKDIVQACEKRKNKLLLGETGGESVIETGELGSNGERLFFAVSRNTDLVPEAPEATAILPDTKSCARLEKKRMAGR